MIEKMPNEFLGEVSAKTQYTKTTPRKWNEREIEWMLKKKEKGFNNKQIAEAMGRTEVSVSIKMKRLKKKEGTYNKKHVLEKYETNKVFLEAVEPKSILDVYCGEKSYYRNNTQEIEITDNDISEDIEADYNLDALKFLCLMYNKGNKYDIVDLDPFGSAYDCFDLAVKMAKKGLIITLGEMGHKRFKRLDFVRRYYGIESLDDFTTESLINEIIRIGERNKKTLTPIYVREWSQISRVWFSVGDLKITEQWDTPKE